MVNACRHALVRTIFLLRIGTCANGKFSVYQLGVAHVDADIFQLRCWASDERMEAGLQENFSHFDPRPITFIYFIRHNIVWKLFWRTNIGKVAYQSRKSNRKIL